jgi:hypothetical protein
MINETKKPDEVDQRLKAIELKLEEIQNQCKNISYSVLLLVILSLISS